MANYFNTLNLRQQLAQLGKCRFMAIITTLASFPFFI